MSCLLDPNLKAHKEKDLEIICELVQECIQSDPKKRPTMREVTTRLREVLSISPEAATPRLSPLWWAELEILSVEGSQQKCSFLQKHRGSVHIVMQPCTSLLYVSILCCNFGVWLLHSPLPLNLIARFIFLFFAFPLYTKYTSGGSRMLHAILGLIIIRKCVMYNDIAEIYIL